MLNLYNRLHELFEYKDGSLYRKISVQGAAKGKKVGSVRDGGYLQIVVDGKTILAHRAIYLFFNKKLPKYVDHIDGNKTNNKIENLREATKSQNCLNRKLHINNKNGIKNVYLNENNNKWIVKLNVNKNRIHLGNYDDLELAELVAVMAREKFHGKFANHGYKE